MSSLILRNLKATKPWEWLILALALALLLYSIAGCAGTWAAVKSSTWPAGGAAAGAAVGSAAGPVGTIAGAAIGGGAGHLLGENASLRSGELQGEGAADKEVERWRGRAARAESGLSIAESAARLFRIVAWVLVGYLVWLRREWLWRAVRGPSRFRSLIHALVAGKGTRPDA